MRKLYKTIILFGIFIFLTTYSPNELTVFPKKEKFFFKIQNIKIVNNSLIEKSEIIGKLAQIKEKNILSSPAFPLNHKRITLLKIPLINNMV